MGWIGEVDAAIANYRRELDGMAARIKLLEKDKRLNGQTAGVTSGAGRTLDHGSQEDFAFIKITGRTAGSTPPAVSYAARRQTFDDNGAVIDDPDITASMTVLGLGKGAFNGALGFARYCGYYGSGSGLTPVWILATGEWDGFLAKITGAVDGSNTYPWQQIETPAWTIPLSDTKTGKRVKDRASLAYDPAGTNRKAYPTDGTFVVEVKYDPTANSGAGEFFFYGGAEEQACPTSASCS